MWAPRHGDAAIAGKFGINDLKKRLRGQSREEIIGADLGADLGADAVVGCFFWRR